MTAPGRYPAPTPRRPRSGRRGPDAARRIVGLCAAGLLAIPLVVALAHWQARHFRVDSASIAAEAAKVLEGRISTVRLNNGVITAGPGKVPGIPDTGPDAREYYWMRADGIDSNTCAEIASSYLQRVDVVELRIGSDIIPAPGASTPHAAITSTIATACRRTQDNHLSVVLSFGDTL